MILVASLVGMGCGVGGVCEQIIWAEAVMAAAAAVAPEVAAAEPMVRVVESLVGVARVAVRGACMFVQGHTECRVGRAAGAKSIHCTCTAASRAKDRLP